MRWAIRVGVAVAAVLLVGVAGFYRWSQAVIDRKYVRDSRTLPTRSGPEVLARGQHLAITRGCLGCHTETLQGQEWWNEKWIGSQHTANLTRRAQTYSDADLDRAIRGGVDNKGHALWDMPSDMYANLNDTDTAALIAYIRSVPAGGMDQPKKHFGPGWRWELIRDAEPHSAARRVDESKVPVDAGPPFAAGRYIAMTTCTECHGATLSGQSGPEGKTPDLTIAGAYSDAEFLTLMRTGVPVGGRKLRLMDEVARGRFSHFTDREISDLHAYLKARAAEL